MIGIMRWQAQSLDGQVKNSIYTEMGQDDPQGSESFQDILVKRCLGTEQASKLAFKSWA